MAVTIQPALKAALWATKKDPAPDPAAQKQPAKAPTDYMQHLGGKVVAKQVVGTVEVKKTTNVATHDGSADTAVLESTTDHVVHPGLTVPEQFASVSVQGSRTINLGNYNSVKIGVTLSMPCAPNAKSINETYDVVGDWVSQKLTEAAKANGA